MDHEHYSRLAHELDLLYRLERRRLALLEAHCG